MRPQLGAGVAQRPRDPLPAPAPERAHVLSHVDRAGAGLERQRRQLALGRALADDEARAALAQLAVEVGEALEQELGPRAGGGAAAKETVVEAEHGDDLLVRVERRPQRRMVADAEVAPQPENPAGRQGVANRAIRTTSFAGTSITSSRRKSSAGAV